MKAAVAILLLASAGVLAWTHDGMRTALTVRSIAPGMTIPEAEAILAPRILSKAYSNGWGVSGPTFYYHLQRDLELEMRMGDFARCDRISSVYLQRKQTWDQYFWEPSENDVTLAFETAIQATTDLEDRRFWIRCGNARWRTTRHIDVILARENGWRRSVTVDLDRGKVVR